MVLVRARTTFASRTTKFFYFFLQHFSLYFSRKKKIDAEKDIRIRTLVVL